MAYSSVAPLISSGRAEKLIHAAYRAIHSVLRLFSPHIQGGVLLDLARRALVDIACDQIRRDRPPAQSDKRVTLTELGLKTGIDTRIIQRLLQQPLTIHEHNICAEAAILARWAKDPALRNSYTGKPADLIIHGREGTLQGLVLSIAGRGISVNAVLRRLCDNGNVRLIGKHHVRLIDPTWRFIDDGEETMLAMSANSLASLATTLQHNASTHQHKEQRRTERRVFSCLVPARHRDELESLLNQRLLAMRESFIQLIDQYESDDADGDDETIGVGFYLLREHSPKAE
ncbi:MAG: hypothetical protein Tsb002_10120 [Wenzhouxiangellaceae bacterium]